MVLLHFLKWLKVHKPKYQLDILFVIGGDMEAEFKSLAHNVFYITKKKKGKTINKRIAHRVKRYLGLLEKPISVYQELANQDYDVLYANTAVSVPYASKIKELVPATTLIAHIHELHIVLKTLVPDFENYKLNVTHFIAVSQQVKNNLEKTYKVQSNKLSVVYECAELSYDDLKEKEVQKPFVVGASGYSYWRKGNDVFLQVARYVTKHYPDLDIEYRWVGNEYKDKPIIDADIEKMKLQKHVFFIGQKDNPAKAYNDFDVFLMTSREDPFPLVCIEVAHLKKPIICFEKASGTAEVIKQGGGKVLPYLDIEAMAEAIVFYYNNQAELKVDGEKVKTLFSEFNPSVICPQLFEIIYNRV